MQHPYRVLFAAVVGSHLFGYASPESDYDIHGIHLLPLEKVVGIEPLLGLAPNDETVRWQTEREDVSTHDLNKFVLLMLRGSCTFIVVWITIWAC